MKSNIRDNNYTIAQKILKIIIILLEEMEISIIFKQFGIIKKEIMKKIIEEQKLFEDTNIDEILSNANKVISIDKFNNIESFII